MSDDLTKSMEEKIGLVVLWLMSEYGPDGYTDGSDIITYGVLKTFGYDVKFPKTYNKKEEIDAVIEDALNQPKGDLYE